MAKLLGFEYSAITAGVGFATDIDGTEVKFEVSFEAMSDHFGVQKRQKQAVLDAFQANSDKILAVAEPLQKRPVNKNNVILIGTLDFKLE